MPRRKRLLEDDDSDSSDVSDVDFPIENDPDLREERELFEDPYKRKRRKKNGKESAIYGVFGDDSDEEYGSGKAGRKQRKSDWTKAPAFVASDKKVHLNDEMGVDLGANSGDGEDSGNEGEDDEDREESNSDVSEPSRPPSPRVRVVEEEEEDERPRTGGLGLGASKSNAAAAFMTSFTKFAPESRSETPSATETNHDSRGATPSVFASKGGIGSRSSASTPAHPALGDLPAAFGGRNKRSFVRETSSTPKPTALNAADLAHFTKLKGTFGARMLEKMGWQAGTGLGVSGEGIVTPVETKLRPQKMGIAFKGFKEKTEQSKKEAKRRGETVSDEEEDPHIRQLRKKAKEQAERRSDVWKRPKKVKTKVEHKTYEQIIAEAGEEPPSAGLGQIIDATGAVPREVSSLADISLNTWIPSQDLTRIPEIRHNVRLIADACKSDLDGLAREAKALEERRRWANNEDARLRKRVEDEAELIARLQRVQIVANDISAKAKELASLYEVSLEPFSPLFYTLVGQFSNEFEKYRLDEIVVAAIAPSFRRMVATWNPLQDPAPFLSTFRTWRRALRVQPVDDSADNAVDLYGSATIQASVAVSEKSMTPFESLLWNVWLPKVRTCLNNEWSPESPQPVVKLYEAWSTFLPPFIRDNMMDQLILPKVRKAVADWSPKRSPVPLQSILFPWLPHIGLRMDDVLDEAKRKVKSLLRSWHVGDSLPSDLAEWRDVFDARDWDAMLLKYVVPKLGATLRDEFRVNPRQQDMKPLQQVLQWSKLIRPSIFSQLLETEFFPKWLDVLYIWLIQPRASFAEVAEWYRFWKEDGFPEDVQSMAGFSRGLTRGLQLMNKALELGPNAPTQLPRPDYRAEISAARTTTRNGVKGAAKAPPRPSALAQEITFRSIVEEYAASHNLLFMPTGRAHEKSRMPLYRVSPTADGKGGILVYVLDDAVWAPVGDDGEYRAISLDDMVLKATAKSSSS